MEKKNEGTVRNLITLLLVIFALAIGASVIGDLMHEKGSSTAVVASSSDSDDEENHDYDHDYDDGDDYSSPSSSYSSSSGSSSSSSYSYYSSNSELNPADYEVLDFSTWNHDQLEYGKRVQITGKVLQNMKDGYSYYIRLAVDGDYDKVVLIDIASYDYDDIITEDDSIIFYGTAEGLISYESTWGKEVTLPSMSSEKHTVNSYGN